MANGPLQNVQPIQNLKTFFKQHNLIPPKGSVNEPATSAATSSSDSIANMKELIEASLVRITAHVEALVNKYLQEIGDDAEQKKVLLEEINWVNSQLVELDQELLNET